jgi:hypothetical protein
MTGPDPGVVIQGSVLAPTRTGSVLTYPDQRAASPLLDQDVGKRPFVLIIAPRPGRLSAGALTL